MRVTKSLLFCWRAAISWIVCIDRELGCLLRVTRFASRKKVKAILWPTGTDDDKTRLVARSREKRYEYPRSRRCAE